MIFENVIDCPFYTLHTTHLPRLRYLDPCNEKIIIFLGIASGHCDAVQNRSKCQSINAVIADNKTVFTPESSDDDGKSKNISNSLK